MPELTQEEMKSSQKASIGDGTFYSVMVGAGENFIVPFAIALGANSQLSALVSAFPQFIAAITQLLAVPISNMLKQRKQFIAFGAALQMLVWVPLAALAWWSGPSAVMALIVLYCVYMTLAVLLNPIWSAWMAEIVPEHERGEYFSRRNKITIVASVLSAIAAGWLLGEYAAYMSGGVALAGASNSGGTTLLAPLFHLFSSAGEFGGYALVFALALLARAVSIGFLLKITDAPPQHEVGEKIGLAELFASPAQHESRKFAAYIWLLMCATYVSSPFIAAYMLSGLHLDIFTFSLIAIAASVAKFITLPYWGKLSDRFGPRAVFITTGLLIPFTPLNWLLFTNPVLLFAGELFSGMAWGGFELACFNFVLGRSERPHRTAAVAVYNLSKGTGLFFGTLLGMALFGIVSAHPEFGNAFSAIFLASVLGRLAISLLFLPHFGKDSFGGMSMGGFLWQALAVNPSIGVSNRLSRSFQIGNSLFHSSVMAGESAAKGGFDLVIYAMKRGGVMVSKKMRKKGL